jgi:hypothetical protein
MNILEEKHFSKRIIKDKQKQRVYDFEDKYFVNNSKVRLFPLDKEECRGLISHIMIEHGQEHVPIVVSWYEMDYAECTVRVRGGAGTVHINLPNKYRRAIWVIHEVAHALTPFQQHGPRFVTTYFDLLEKYLGMSYNDLKEAAVNFKGKNGRKLPIEVADRAFAPQKIKKSKLIQFSIVA